MRTTRTIDDDLAAKLKTEAQRAGRPFPRDAAPGLEIGRATARRRAFKLTARDLGNLKSELSLDNIAELIEHVEGPLHR